jgi:hypothetical protein
MIPPLYEHQKKIIDDDPKKCLLALGTGSAKTRTALEMATGATLVICPKQQREDCTWENNAEKFGIMLNLTVISKETFKRDWQGLGRFETVIIDECHTVLGVTADTRQRKGEQIPKTSQIFEAVREFLTQHPPERLYLCSATPVSKPMNLWAIATLFGQQWDYFEFRRKYYFESRMGARRIWLPRKDDNAKDRLANLVKKFGYTGGLENFFDVPEQTHKEVYIDLSKEQIEALKQVRIDEADPMVRRARERTIENGVLYGKKVIKTGEKEDTMVKDTKIYHSNKIDYILERAIEFPKMLIFANYTAQIYEIEKALKEADYKVVTLTGATKDRKSIIGGADNSRECIVVAQCSISSGYELPTFPCVIFASKGWQYLHYEQGIGRVQRANAIKKNLYIHLVVRGGTDEDCHKSIMSGRDFHEKVMSQDEEIIN